MTDHEPVPGFLEIVDAEIARIDALFAAFMLGAQSMALASMAAQAQRTTEASARAVRASAHRAGLPAARGWV